MIYEAQGEGREHLAGFVYHTLVDKRHPGED